MYKIFYVTLKRTCIQYLIVFNHYFYGAKVKDLILTSIIVVMKRLLEEFRKLPDYRKNKVAYTNP